MITIHPAASRGQTEIDWLDSRHTFSFGNFHDPKQMGFRALRVINEDRVQPGCGFGTHGHRDMEIISYVLEGALEHRDSLGTGSVIHPGDVQRMTAGIGVMHSERNPSPIEPVHFLQIWLLPEREGLTPGYEQKAFPVAERQGRLRLVASQDGREGSLTVHQDVSLYATLLSAGEQVVQPLAAGRFGWVQIIRGALRVNGSPVGAGDGVSISDEREVRLEASEASEALIFDLA